MSNKLLQNFYKEISSTFSAANQYQFESRIKLNAAHPVYKGHFEQVPIAPGVCLVQIITEILNDKFCTNFRLKSADNIKFLVLINPAEGTEFKVNLSITAEN